MCGSGHGTCERRCLRTCVFSTRARAHVCARARPHTHRERAREKERERERARERGPISLLVYGKYMRGVTRVYGRQNALLIDMSNTRPHTCLLPPVYCHMSVDLPQGRTQDPKQRAVPERPSEITNPKRGTSVCPSPPHTHSSNTTGIYTIPKRIPFCTRVWRNYCFGGNTLRVATMSLWLDFGWWLFGQTVGQPQGPSVSCRSMPTPSPSLSCL